MGIFRQIRQIVDQQAMILKRLNDIERNVLGAPPPDPDKRLLNKKEIINELGISNRTFYRIVNDLPFLFRINGQYRAIRENVENWKQNRVQKK